MSDLNALVERLYASFNAHELGEAAALFAGDSVLEHAARRIVRPYFDR